MLATQGSLGVVGGTLEDARKNNADLARTTLWGTTITMLSPVLKPTTVDWVALEFLTADVQFLWDCLELVEWDGSQQEPGDKICHANTNDCGSGWWDVAQVEDGNEYSLREVVIVCFKTCQFIL